MNADQPAPELEVSTPTPGQMHAELQELRADRAIGAELWRQIDELRAESIQQHNQITQLSESLAALLEAIVGTTPSAEAVEAATELVVGVPAAPVAADPPPLVLAPYVPANEPLRPHLEPKPEAPEFTLDSDDDRVGVFTELMAVADHSVPESAAGSRAEGATDESPPAATGMDILPAAEPAPPKRRRLPRLSS